VSSTKTYRRYYPAGPLNPCGGGRFEPLLRRRRSVRVETTEAGNVYTIVGPKGRLNFWLIAVYVITAALTLWWVLR